MDALDVFKRGVEWSGVGRVGRGREWLSASGMVVGTTRKGFPLPVPHVGEALATWALTVRAAHPECRQSALLVAYLCIGSAVSAVSRPSAGRLHVTSSSRSIGTGSLASSHGGHF